MKVLAKYISGIFVKNYFLSALSLTSLYVFQAILGQLFNHEYTVDQVLIYNALDFPLDFVQMTPPAILFGTVFTLSSLSRSNELFACYSIGVGLRHVMTIILSLVFMASCLVLVLQDRVLPPLFKQ